MQFKDFDPNGAATTANIQEELLICLERFVNLMASVTAIDIHGLPEIRTLICQFYERAPVVACAFADTIMEYHGSDKSEPESTTEGSNNHQTTKRKRSSSHDPSYQAPYPKKQASNCGESSSDGALSLKTNESQQTVDSLPVLGTAPLALPLITLAPDTPITQNTVESPLPHAEKIHQTEVPTSPKSISPPSPPGSITGMFLSEAVPLIDIIIESVRIIHQFSIHQQSVPKEVYLRILQTLQNDNQKAIEELNLNQWSDGSIWIQVLEMGSTQNQKGTILNMLEYMGAWEWYDKQIKVSKETIRTKKNKPVGHRGAAIHVLNQIQGRWIGGVGRVSLTDGDATALSKDSNLSITERDKRAQRKRISMQLSRGQKLRTKLVRELGLGILFSPNIWDFTKMSGEQLDTLIHGIQADPRQMKLLGILGPQLEQLINRGHPDLQVLYDALSKEELVSQEELQGLRATFALDSDAILLDTAVDMLVENVSKVLGKQKLEDTDSIVVNNNVELSCSIFQRLRGQEWFDDWIIMAAMDISDKPIFVRHRKSVPLDNIGRGQTTPFKRPLAAWAKEITKLHHEARDRFGDTMELVYFCPLNHGNMHFTLLEINEQQKAIRHYDSMAKQSTDLTRVGRLVQEEFSNLDYVYSEAPTPQQRDHWSCGVRVVWNFRRISNNLPIGGWDAMICPERMKMEIVEGFVASLQSNAIRNYQRQCSKSSTNAEDSSDSEGRLEEPATLVELQRVTREEWRVNVRDSLNGRRGV